MELPLTGIKVLDLTHALAGPYASMILADLGADVIKIEAAPAGDFIRSWGIMVGEESTFNLCTNRNKRGVLLDLRAPDSILALRTMADRCDVLLENFRPGVVEKMGLGYELVSRTNPGIVFGSISGFGRTGPRAAEPGFDVVAQALSGVMSINGQMDGDPLRVGLPLGDLGAGMWLALGVVAAVRQRDLTGRGQRVDTSLLSTLLNMLAYHSQAYLTAERVPARTGNSHPSITPYGAFQAGDGLMVIAPGSPGMWPAFCGVVGLDHLVDHPDYATPQARTRRTKELKRLIEERLSTDTAAQWTAKLLAAGIPAAQINSIDQALEDPQVKACGLIESIAHPHLGEWKVTAGPVVLSGAGASPTTRLPPPQPGEHSVECLRDMGVEEALIDRLLSSGALIQAPATNVGGRRTAQ